MTTQQHDKLRDFLRSMFDLAGSKLPSPGVIRRDNDLAADVIQAASPETVVVVEVGDHQAQAVDDALRGLAQGRGVMMSFLTPPSLAVERLLYNVCEGVIKLPTGAFLVLALGPEEEEESEARLQRWGGLWCDLSRP